MSADSPEPGRPQEHDPLYAGVARLTRSLHDSLRELGLDSRLAAYAGNEIPDACSRLDYVVQMTEDAAHRTLDLVDEARAVADEIADVRRHLARLRDQAGGAPGELEASSLAVADAEARLREVLTALAQSQEYQDLSGQIIRRVITLVRNVESALLELLGAGGFQLRSALPITEPGALAGPALPGAQAADQDDADQLLAGLGF
jgi:chemotaxis protein CheZ